METSLNIIYQDDAIVAIHKPAGVMTHRSRIAEDDEPSAMELLRDQLGCWVYPIHRLDRATSGLLLFGLDQDSARRLHQSFAQSEVTKRYLAITRGHAPAVADVNRPLKEKRDRMTDRQAAHDKPPQSAHTSIQTWAHCTLPVSLGRYPTSRFSLVSVQPHTGRRHQIRRHLAGLSYPLIGDTTHGRGELNRFFRDHFSCRRLLLAAVELSIKHPHESRQLDLVAPMDGVMASVCHSLFLQPQSTSSRDDMSGDLGDGTVNWLQDASLLHQRIASS